ncbi:MAG: DUF1934 domain-containing protein [Bacilli bacterium]
MDNQLQKRMEPIAVIVHIQTQSKQLPDVKPRQTTGQLQQMGDSLYLSYSEDETEMGRTTTRYKFERKTSQGLTLIRSGDISMRQVFVPNEVTYGRYESPFGTFQMETTTKHTAFSWDGIKGEIKLDYRLRMNEDDLGRFRLHIKFEKVFN